MFEWLTVATKIIGAIKTAISIIKGISTGGKRLLQKTYDIKMIQRDITESRLGIGSRVKMIGRYSEYIPFVDISKLLRANLISHISSMNKEESKELIMCVSADIASLIGTCRLPQIEKIWPAAMFLPDSDDATDSVAIPIFFDETSSSLLNALSGDLVEVDAKISPIPQRLAEYLNPDPTFTIERKDKSKIPVCLQVENVRSISQIKRPFFIDIWLVGHYEPFPRKTTLCPLSRTYTHFHLDNGGELGYCPYKFTACGSSRRVENAGDEKLPPPPMGRDHLEKCFFFENIGNRFFRIGKGKVDLQAELYQRHIELLGWAAKPNGPVIMQHLKDYKFGRQLGRKRYVLDFQHDQRHAQHIQSFSIEDAIKQLPLK